MRWWLQGIDNILRRKSEVFYFPNERYNKNMKWLSWATMALGIWLIVSPFLLGYWRVSSALWSQIAAGVIVGLIALWQIVEAEDDITNNQ